MDPRNGRRRTSYPRERRTIAVRSYGDDSGKEFRCWNCGFLCRTDRDNFGGAEEGSFSTTSGSDYTTGAITPRPTQGNPLSFQLNNVVPGSKRSVLMEVDGSGDEVQINLIHVFYSTGCQGCGTMVWKR